MPFLALAVERTAQAEERARELEEEIAALRRERDALLSGHIEVLPARRLNNGLTPIYMYIYIYRYI